PDYDTVPLPSQTGNPGHELDLEQRRVAPSVEGRRGPRHDDLPNTVHHSGEPVRAVRPAVGEYLPRPVTQQEYARIEDRTELEVVSSKSFVFEAVSPANRVLCD